MQDKDVWHRPKRDHFQGTDMLTATGTVPCISLVELFTFHEFFKAVFQLDALLILVGDERQGY
jgi:hypothetical protein